MAQAQTAIRLGDWLLEQGHVTRTQLELALSEQKRKGKLLGETLVELGFVSREVLSRFLAQKTQTESVSLEGLEIPAEPGRLIPEALARLFRAVAIACEGGVLTVAISDPLNVTAFDVLEQITGMRVKLVAAAEGEILEVISRLYSSGPSVADMVEELLKLGHERLASTTEQDAPMIRLVDRIIAEAVIGDASDIHIHPEEKIVRVRFRKDGLLDAGYLLPKELQPALVARLKIVGAMDIAETRRPQGGRAKVTVATREAGLRFSTLPTSSGESVVVRLLDRGGVNLSLQELGFEPAMESEFRKVLERPHGIILVTGPTGSGKTTTLYTALTLIRGSDKSIFTLEDPIEYQLPLVRQTQINEVVGLTFAEGLRTLLRQDPDVILVGETRDTETAKLMVRAALTGHLVFSTLHTNDAMGAIPRLVDLGVEPYLLAPTLVAVVAQRLVRRLCLKCRIPVVDPASKLAGLNIQASSDAPLQLWEAAGCAECGRSGYRGRIGLFEFLPLDSSFQAAIAKGIELDRIQKIAHERGFRTILEDGLRKAQHGLTTIEELLRVTQQ